MARLVELGEAGVLRPGKWRWARALAWMFALIAAVILAMVVVTAVFAFVLGLSGAVPRSAIAKGFNGFPPVLAVLGITIASLGALGSYVGLVRWVEKRPLTELAPRTALPELLAGLAIGAAMMLLTGLALWATGWAHYERQPVTAISRALMIGIEPGIVEELVLRLIVFRLVWRAFGVWPALIFSAALFGIMHIFNPDASLFATICIAFEAGIMLAAFYVLTGRLWLSMGLHAGWNFTQGWVLGSPVSGGNNNFGGPIIMHPTPGVPAWMSGGAFGPEASVAALTICTAVGLGVLWLAYNRGRMDEPAAVRSY